METQPHLFLISHMVAAGFLFFLLSSGSFAQDPEEHYQKLRQQMVTEQITSRGVKDERVIRAMREVKRHLFVPALYRDSSYSDYPVPIGEGQTISQPYIVAFMTELLQLKDTDRVLEIGTGSGYQAAILAEIAKEVYTIEILPGLSESAKKRLAELGYKNIHCKCGDGYLGWPEFAPFDAIIVTAAPPSIPQELVKQLAEGGRMVVPVGGGLYQELVLIQKKEGKVTQSPIIGVRFVPMIHGKE